MPGTGRSAVTPLAVNRGRARLNQGRWARTRFSGAEQGCEAERAANGVTAERLARGCQTPARVVRP